MPLASSASVAKSLSLQSPCPGSGTEPAHWVTGRVVRQCTGSTEHNDFWSRAPSGRLRVCTYLPTENTQKPFSALLCYWPCFIDQQTEGARNVKSHVQGHLPSAFRSGFHCPGQPGPPALPRNARCGPSVTPSRCLMHGSSDSRCYFLRYKLTSWGFGHQSEARKQNLREWSKSLTSFPHPWAASTSASGNPIPFLHAKGTKQT